MSLDRIFNSGNNGIKDEKDYHSMYSVGINEPFRYLKKRKNNISKIALAVIVTGAIGISTILYANAVKKSELNLSNQRTAIENRENTKNAVNNKKKNKISLNIEGIVEDFVFSPEPVKEKELNQGIIVWEKIKEGRYKGEKIKYPTGHLYVFKDISTRKIVGKFAVSGGIIGRNVESINTGVYVLNKFDLWPDYVDNMGKVIFEGGHPENPWGYGRFYHYPVAENDSIINMLSMKSFKRKIYPDKKQRYLHADALLNENINGKEDYENKKKEIQETNFQPNRTIGCTKTSNYAMNFLEKGINTGFFRLAYTSNIKKE